MNTNVNLEAAVGVLSFLGTAFVLGLAVIIVLHAIKTRKHARARTFSPAALALIGLYPLAESRPKTFMQRRKGAKN